MILLVILLSSHLVSYVDNYKIRLVPFPTSAFRGTYNWALGNGYLKWTGLKWELPVISNLNSNILGFAEDKCLVVIDNFLEINLPHMEIPTILRSPSLLAVEKEIVFVRGRGVETEYDHHVLWGLSNTISYLGNTTFGEGDFIECRQSKHLTGIQAIGSLDYFQDMCIRLNLTSFSPRIKPWNCQLHVQVFPPLGHVNFIQGYKHPKVFKLSEATSTMHSLAFGQYPGNIVITLDSTNSFFDDLISLRTWVDETVYYPGIILHDVFFIFTINQTYEKIVSMNIFKPCSDCLQSSESIFPFSNADSFNSTYNVPELRRIAQIEEEERLTWVVEVDREQVYNPLEQLETFLRTPPHENFRNWLISGEQSREAQVAHLFSNVWRSIMQNYTSAPTYGPFDIRLKVVSFAKGFSFYPYVLTDESRNLRFISCDNRRGRSALRFAELYSIFDHFVWLLILITAVMIIVPLNLVHIRAFSFEKFIAHLLSVLKGLLEQGNPFLTSIENVLNLRLMLALFLLMGTILSNGYKNSNVYNMIIPRAPVYLEKFQELVPQNISVYTRLSFKRLRSKHSTTECEYDIKIPDALATKDDCLHSEVTSIILSVKNLVFRQTVYVQYVISKDVADFQRKVIESLDVVLLGVYNHSRLHPSTEAALERNEPIDIIKKREEQEIYESLKSCQNVAFILPEKLCRDYERFFKRNMNIKKNVISVGTEIYSSFGWFFALEGRVPPHVILRYKAAGTSGIWAWLMKLSSNATILGRGENDISIPPKPASIQGNVVVIFAVWICGQFVAMVGFVVEFREEIYRRIWKLCKWVLSAFHNLIEFFWFFFRKFALLGQKDLPFKKIPL